MIKLMGDELDGVRIWLDGVRDAVEMIDVYTDDLTDLHARRTRITSTLRAVSASGGDTGDRRQDATICMIEVEQRLRAALSAYREVRDDACGLIGKVRSCRQREVLHRRYILRQRFPQIAGVMGITDRQVFKLHTRGLIALKAIREARE